MRAVLYTEFGQPPAVENVSPPATPSDGAVIRVKASGVCLSDWRGWMGHDPLITLPHVPGHELAGVIEEVGSEVANFRRGDRITIPFVAGCGTCPQCLSGNQQICDNQYQPGFSGWGSFAELVAVRYADQNLVRLPADMNYVTAASLGCRFATAFRGVVVQGGVTTEQWVAVHGCGGVGLSAIMIASALGARVAGIDIDDRKLELAKQVGAIATVNACKVTDIVAAICDVTDGGAHLSLDALGDPETCFNSVACLRKRGRHVQIGLLTGAHTSIPLPMDQVIGRELELVGSHGMQAHRYNEMLGMVSDGLLEPSKLVGDKISLEEAARILPRMNQFKLVGVTVIDRF